VNLVHHEDSVFARGGGVADGIDQFADIIDPGPTGGIDFLNVIGPASGDFSTRRALPAGRFRRTLVTVQ
jgi:hypothetical protein